MSPSSASDVPEYAAVETAVVTEVEELEDLLVREGRKLERRAGEARAIATEGKALAAAIEELEALNQSLEEGIGVLNSYADSRQATLQAQIESLVTRGLTTVFDEAMTFHIVQAQKGKLSAMDFVIRSQNGDMLVETPVMGARGGGVAAVVGFLLRLVILLLRSEDRPVLFLDESFAQVSAEYEPRVAEFLRELVDRTPVQIVLVTHSDAFSEVADRVYRFSMDGGVTKVAAES